MTFSRKDSASTTQRPALLWALWAVFTGLVIFLARFHEPWIDEFYVWFMCRNYSLAELWSAMTKEGHFMLWHLLVFPFVKAGCSYWCLQLVSIALVSGAAWLLLMKAPFDLLSKVLILFCYPLVYEFPVIARCYALIPPVLFLIATFYHRQDEHPFWYCTFVGLLSMTHAYMEGLVGALFLLFCYEHFYLPRKKGQPVEKKYIGAACVTVGIVLLAGLQVAGSLAYAHDTFTGSTDTPGDVWRKLMVYTYAFPVKFLARFLPESLGSSLDTIGTVLSVLTWLLVLGLSYIIFWKNRENRKWILVGVAGIGWQVMMAIFVFYLGNQRVYLPLLVILFLLWCAWSRQSRTASLLTVLCLFILTGRYGEVARDVQEIHSSELPLHDRVVSSVPEGSPLWFFYDREINRQDQAYSSDVLECMYPGYTTYLDSEPESAAIPEKVCTDEDKDYYIITAAPLTEAPGYRIREIGYFPAGYHQHFPFEHIYSIRKSIIDQNI